MKLKTELSIEEYKELQNPVRTLTRSAEVVQIENDQDAEKASVLVKSISDLRNKVDQTRRSVTDPIYQAYKNANEFFNQFLIPLKQADSTIRSKMNTYRTRQEDERRKRQAELDKIFAKEQERLNKKAEKLGVEAPVLQAPSVVETEKKVGVTKFKTVWDFEVTDFASLPDEYKMADIPKIREAIRVQKVREIKGLKIFQKEQVSL